MDRHAWIDEQLAAVPLFEGLSKKQLRRISSLMTRIDRPFANQRRKDDQVKSHRIILADGFVDPAV